MNLFARFIRSVFLKELSIVFDRRHAMFGETPKGVLWKNTEGQQLRFEILAGILDDLPPTGTYSVNDYGCGYGALFDYLDTLPAMPALSYTGYDLSGGMIDAARVRTRDRGATFTKGSRIKIPADVTLVSGTFNLKLKVGKETWKAYVKSSLQELWSVSNKGLAFNMLDKDHPEKGDGLFYADADEFLDFCSEFSGNATLIEDYPLHEWTIFIRR